MLGMHDQHKASVNGDYAYNFFRFKLRVGLLFVDLKLHWNDISVDDNKHMIIENLFPLVER